MTQSFDNCFVGFFDILGFKDLVSNNTHKFLESLYIGLIDNYLNVWKDLINKHTKFDLNTDKDHQINVLMISDSLILWTNEISFISCSKFIGLANLLIHESIMIGIPIRGAISVGPLTIFENDNIQTLFGRSLTDACILENNQNWAGGIISKNFVDYVNMKIVNYPADEIIRKKNKPFRNVIDFFKYKEDIVKYKVPLKSGKVKYYYALNWPKAFKPNRFMNQQKILDSFAEYNKNTSDWKVENIKKNTLEFYLKNAT